MTKKKGSKGLIESINDAPCTLYDPDNFSFDDLLKTMDEYDKRERARKKQWDEECKKIPLTELEIAIHKKSDALLGLYPMTKEKLLERIELIPNAMMQIDFYGNMFPHKASLRSWIHYLGDDMTHEQLYMSYLTDVKPYIYEEKNKVTLPKGEVDKPEVFQHWTSGIDPYHIEPIDNPQKPTISKSIVSDTIKDLNSTYEKIYNKDLLNQMKYYTPSVVYEEKTPEEIMNKLKFIKMFHPEVLEQFIKEHYGK